MRQLWAPWRMVYVGGQPEHEEGCFLCRAEAAEDDVATYVVERSALTFTLLNRFPYNSGHLMVVPRRHTPDVLSLTDEEGAAVLAATRRALRAVAELMHPEGFNIGINHGGAAGASVEHMHQHVVPRWHGDTNFMPVLGDVKVLPEHLDRTAEQLRAALQSMGR